MSDSIELEATVAATPEQVFDAWIDGERHAAMTGGEAESDPRAGGRFSAWGGYITGTHEELERPRRIAQRWRTSEFPEGAPDSRVEVMLEPVDGGTRIRLVHTEIPDGQGPKYDDGWKEHYFEPMREHFG